MFYYTHTVFPFLKTGAYITQNAAQATCAVVLPETNTDKSSDVPLQQHVFKFRLRQAVNLLCGGDRCTVREI